MDDFIHAQGEAYLAHLLRRLSDLLVRGAAEWYPEAGVTAPPRTTSTLLALDDNGPLAVTELAVLLRQSHPLVIDWRRQLLALGLVETKSDPNDARRSVVALTPRGRQEVRRLRRALLIMEKASRRLMKEAGAQLFEGLCAVDEALEQRPFTQRLRQEVTRPRAAKP
ncbi:MarR family winged helix-turn-helix transcriptional regulator [Terricaulis sp.]|uniref:MarR family winged helix-turn-helix transcriptional regulator n=1 Tax=Terricaulis sp. TaxID=2768686 RepID=UPI0037843AA3